MDPGAEERLRLITQTISEVFWIATYDMSRTLYVSPAYERVWGRTCESLYADPRSYLEAIHPDDRAKVMASIGGEREGATIDHEYRIVRGDGAIRWIWNRGYPVRDAAGRVEYYVGVSQDITDRKIAEVERGAFAERFHLVASVTNDAVWDWDLVAWRGWWSDAIYDLLGYDRAVVPSVEGWLARIHPACRERASTLLPRAIEQRASSLADEYQLLLPDGTVRDIFDRALVIYDAAGTAIRAVGAMMDVTARRSLEAQLRHAQKMEAIGQLAGGVAHDFNNILQAMMLEIDLLQAAPGMPREAIARLDDLRTGADRAARLTRQLLVFSRREVVQARGLDLNAVIVDLARMLHRLLREDIALQLELAPAALWVHADPGMLDQVLVNLAVNARDAMPRGGTLSIATALVDHPGGGGREPGRYARVTVKDSGTGIAADVLPHVFEPFFTTKEAGKGTGLGLATAYGIVEQHGGWIAVESLPGRGAMFAVHLPAAEPPLLAEVDDVAAVAPGHGETILIVEDDDRLRRGVRQLFEEHGYRVIDAANGAAALEAARRANGSIDLVLTDLVMPGELDGWELAASLEADRPGLRVVFATGYHPDVNDRAIAAHQRLLYKPVTAERLLGAVRSLLDATS